jgi:hypothetical protein
LLSSDSLLSSAPSARVRFKAFANERGSAGRPRLPLVGGGGGGGGGGARTQGSSSQAAVEDSGSSSIGVAVPEAAKLSMVDEASVSSSFRLRPRLSPRPPGPSFFG